VIGRPFKLGRKPTRRWAYFMSVSTWFYSAAFASLPFFGVGKYVPEGLLTSCSFNYLSHDWATKIFILAFFVGAWVVPMIIMVYSYSSIIWVVVQSRRTVAQIASGTTGIISLVLLYHESSSWQFYIDYSSVLGRWPGRPTPL